MKTFMKRSKLSLKKALTICISRKSNTAKLEATGFSVKKDGGDRPPYPITLISLHD